MNMPPKPKYTKAEIVSAAVEIVSRSGIEALTAKELGSALNTSATPVFTVFDSMKEVQDEVKKSAMERFEAYARVRCDDVPMFKQVGMQMISFAKSEPRLFRLIFMSQSDGVLSFDDVYARLGSTADECLSAIERDYGLTNEKAMLLFKHCWIYTFGIGSLCATGACKLSEEEISQMLTTDFTAMMIFLKSGKEEKQ